MTAAKLRVTVSGKVRRLRQERRWTQARLAALLGLSQNRLSEIERGEGSFTAEQLLVLLRTFNVPVDFFYPGKPAEERQIQNALARLGASHLIESPDVLPSDRLKEASDAIRETLVTAESPRCITGVAPVLVDHIHNLNLNRLKGQLAEVGLDRRLGWTLENTLEAIRGELRRELPRDWLLKYRRAETALKLFLAPWLAFVGDKQAPEDILDSVIVSEETVKELRAESSRISRRWRIVSRIRLDDFAHALRSVRGAD